MVLGTVTEESLLVNPTVAPPVSAGDVTVIVQFSVPRPTTLSLAQVKSFSMLWIGCPLPLSRIVTALFDAFVFSVTAPVNVLALVGSNVSVKDAV